MSKTNTCLIKGVTVSEVTLFQALDTLHDRDFSKTEFGAALVAAGQTEAQDSDFTRRVMQHLKQNGFIAFDDPTGVWSLTPLGRMRLPTRTLPLKAVAPPSNWTTAHLPTPAQNTADRVSDGFRIVLSGFACFALIAALISLNASFAWELGGEAPQFRFAFVAALMALDLMRAFLVAAGFWLASRSKLMTAALAFCIAFALSPVSILSSTSILSASVLLGAEINTDADTRTQTREALRGEHERLLARAVNEERLWRIECARGGCGPIAEAFESQLKETVAEAQAVLNEILRLSQVDEGTSALLARMVTTFEGLGLFGQDRQILLPLLLAISLELGALFGPVLLLRRRV